MVVVGFRLLHGLACIGEVFTVFSGSRRYRDPYKYDIGAWLVGLREGQPTVSPEMPRLILNKYPK